MPMERITKIIVEESEASPGSTSPSKTLCRTTVEMFGLTPAEANGVANKLLDVAKALNDADTAVGARPGNQDHTARRVGVDQVRRG